VPMKVQSSPFMYARPEGTFADLQATVAERTGIAPSEQELRCNDETLDASSFRRLILGNTSINRAMSITNQYRCSCSSDSTARSDSSAAPARP
jgi:hypothetical protein